LIAYLDVAPLRWSSAAIRGATPGTVVGDPRQWRDPVDTSVLDGRRCALATADPRWYAPLLRQSRPALVAIDVCGEWPSFCAPAIRDCVRHAHLVTITAVDYRRLPRTVLEGVRLGHDGGPALIVKNGGAGVHIRCRGATIELPAPPVRTLRTDVGAGDLLLGCLAANLDPHPDGLTPEELRDAYER
jgi:hypothetical protein